MTSSVKDYPGLFVVIEGIDGAGKTTLANKLADKIKKHFGKEVHLTTEPSHMKIGKLLREYLKTSTSIKEVDALLFAADRLEHYYHEILPELHAGKIVISDRYALSSIAYQGAQGIPVPWIEEINRNAPNPDVTILLDVSIPTALNRIQKDQRTVIEKFEKETMLQKVQAIYKQYEKAKSIKTIDGESPLDDVVSEAFSVVAEILSPKK